MSRRIFLRTILAIVVAVFGLVALSGNLYAQGKSDQGLATAIAAQEKHTDALMAKDGVEGTAVGLDENGRAVVKVFTAAQGIGGIPANLEGVPVEVVVTGKFVARADFDRTLKYRPAPIGVSTGHPDITAGTIGCRVTDGTNVYALSNNHVYANQNQASIYDAVIQPGTYDGGSSPTDDIGTLFDFEPINFKGNARNQIDAAIALSTTGELDNATPYDGYGVPSSTTATAFVGQSVQKYGRTTGWTHGNVTAINAVVRVSYGTRSAVFDQQIVVEPGTFSAGGDSGSLIVTETYTSGGINYDRNPVGLLFAGSSSDTIANPIDLVLDRFGVTVDDTTDVSLTTGSISGTVTSANNKSTISGANVSLDTGQSTTTNGIGYYELNGVPTGSRSVTASATGFESSTQSVNVSENATTTADFSLTQAASGGGSLSVVVTTDPVSLTLGDRVYITVAVTNSGSLVAGAAVHVEIKTPNNKLYAGDSTTASNGEALFSFKTKKPDGTGTFDVNAVASMAGYSSASGSTTFEVQ